MRWQSLADCSKQAKTDIAGSSRRVEKCVHVGEKREITIHARAGIHHSKETEQAFVILK